MSDLNLTPDSEPIPNILKLKKPDRRHGNSQQTTFYGPIGTFNDLTRTEIMENRIDYFFVEKCLTSLSI